MLKISARTGEGLEDFKKGVEKILIENQIYLERNYSYQGSRKDPADQKIRTASLRGVYP